LRQSGGPRFAGRGAGYVALLGSRLNQARESARWSAEVVTPARLASDREIRVPHFYRYRVAQCFPWLEMMTVSG